MNLPTVTARSHFARPAPAASLPALAAIAAFAATALTPTPSTPQDTQAEAQIPTFDLSDETAATVVPSEFEGGFLAGVGDVLVNDLGIWVADYRNVEVLWFGPDGALRRRFGREGSGPGEFEDVSIVGVDSLLVVDDGSLGRRVRFRLDGSHVETSARPLDDAVALRGGYAVGVDAAEFVVSFQPGLGVEDFNDKVVLLHPGGESADTLFAYHWGRVAWKTSAAASLWPNPFGASGAWAALGDSAVALADGSAGTLSIVAPEAGEIRTATVDLGLEVRPVTDREMAELETAIRGIRYDLPREMEIDAPAVWSVARDMIAESDRTFWLRQAVEGENEEWIVFDRESGGKRRVVLPERFRLKAVRGGLLYGVVRDELDVPSVGALPDPVAAGGARSPGP